MKQALAFLLLLSAVQSTMGQVTSHTVPDKPEVSGYTVTRVPQDRAQALLNALIPDGKKFTPVQVYTAGDITNRVDLGLSCSSSSSSSGKVDDDGNIRMSGSGSGSCNERHENLNTVMLGFASSDPSSTYMLTAECVEAYIWNHCETPPPGVNYNVVLERAKHGEFKIYIGVQTKIGGKGKVSTWRPLYLEYVTPNKP